MARNLVLFKKSISLSEFLALYQWRWRRRRAVHAQGGPEVRTAEQRAEEPGERMRGYAVRGLLEQYLSDGQQHRRQNQIGVIGGLHGASRCEFCGRVIVRLLFGRD